MLNPNSIGRIQRVPLREVWKHEALDFTVWLQQNLDILNDVLDIDLQSAEREQAAGSFNVDLVAEDADGNVIVIENQLEKSNHDHLGKLITYLVSMDAKTAIWIVSEPRPEHVASIAWLNEATSAQFYLYKLEAVKIGESEPAPLFTLIVGPSEEAKEVGRSKQELSERHLIRRKFWIQLLELAKENNTIHANISPNNHSWLGAGSGVSGLGFNYGIRKFDTQAELYIDRGKEKDEENKKIYNSLFENREEIEAILGSELDWQSLEGKRACRIVKTIDIGGYRDDEERWDEIHLAMIETMDRLEKALAPFISKLKLR